MIDNRLGGLPEIKYHNGFVGCNVYNQVPKCQSVGFWRETPTIFDYKAHGESRSFRFTCMFTPCEYNFVCTPAGGMTDPVCADSMVSVCYKNSLDPQCPWAVWYDPALPTEATTGPVVYDAVPVSTSFWCPDKNQFSQYWYLSCV